MSVTTTKIALDYQHQSEVRGDTSGTKVLLALDASRGAVGLRAKLREPALVRDALATAFAILGSDLRYRRKDRAAYLAYLAKQGKKATKEIWEAQKAFLDESLDGEEKESHVLDPIVTVDPDGASLEVFSRDESTYARLFLPNALLDARQAAHGTSTLSLTPEVIESVERLRTYLPVELDASTQVATAQGARKDPDVPTPWLRGFLQVQAAATLPAATCELAPIDLYNLLYVLRMNKAKKSPRALRFELVPGARPRLIVEPWEIVLECHGPVYAGKTPRVVRTFGRQRLLSLARLLPHVTRARVQLVGAGLPVFWVLEAGGATLTIGLTGWTESGWSSAAAFDALTPRDGAGSLADRIDRILVEKGPQTIAQIQEAVGEDPRAALQLECLRGRALFDLATGTYRPRHLLANAIDEQEIRYGSERERAAHRLLGGAGKVTITKLHEIVGEGLEIVGEITDVEARRTFSPSFTLDLEGRVAGASCGCPTFKRAGLREGPCEHMIALRLAYARRRAEEEALRRTPEGRRLIRAETRTYVKRTESGTEITYRVSLDDRAVAMQWGERTAAKREQRLWFDTDREARDAYFARLDELAGEGFIDADASA